MTEYDLKDVDMWVDEYGFGEDIIEEALSKTRGASNPSVRYVTAVLKDWYEHNLKTLEDVRSYEEKRTAEMSALRGKAASLRRDNRDNFTLDASRDTGVEVGTGIRMPRLMSDTTDEEHD